jgi:tetratricopeptide (TPR) repeat protein
MKGRIAVLIIAACTAQGALGAEPNALWHDYQTHAAREQNSGNFGEAARLHKLAVEEMQNLPDIPEHYLATQLSNTSTALLGLRRYDEALQYSGQAVELLARINVPIDFKLQVMLNHGTVLLENDRVAVGEAICQEALDMTPATVAPGFHMSRVTAHACLAIASLKQGRFEAAEQHYQTARNLHFTHPEFRRPSSLSNIEAAYLRHRAAAEQKFGAAE